MTHELQDALCSWLPVFEASLLRHLHDFTQRHAFHPSILQDLKGHCLVGSRPEPLLLLLNTTHLWSGVPADCASDVTSTVVFLQTFCFVIARPATLFLLVQSAKAIEGLSASMLHHDL